MYIEFSVDDKFMVVRTNISFKITKIKPNGITLEWTNKPNGVKNITVWCLREWVKDVKVYKI